MPPPVHYVFRAYRGAMKSDFKKQIQTYGAKRGVFSVVTVPRLKFLMIDGHGDPNTAQAYKDALTTLYPVAYKLKFFSKTELGQDYGCHALGSAVVVG